MLVSVSGRLVYHTGLASHTYMQVSRSIQKTRGLFKDPQVLYDDFEDL